MSLRNALLVGAACVISIQGAFAVAAYPDSVLWHAIVLGASQLAALSVVWQSGRDPEHLQQDHQQLVAYAAGLFAVFAPVFLHGVIDWVWLPQCETAPNAIASGGADLIDRGLTATLATLIFFAILQSIPRSSPGAGQRIPSRTSVTLVAAATYLSGWMLGQFLLTETSLTPWCKRITDIGLDNTAQIYTSAIAGLVEEFAFTGSALVLLMRCRWQTIAAGVAVNVATRSLGHLYYADHHNVGGWIAWVTLWSGAPLIIAFLVGRRALATGMPTRRLVLTYTLTVVAAHSICDLVPAPAIPTAWAVLVLIVMALIMNSPTRRPLHWLAPEQAAPEKPHDELAPETSSDTERNAGTQSTQPTAH